jgi:hypothetical protein
MLRPSAARSAATAAVETEPASPQKSRLSNKVILAIVLNVVALIFVLWFFHVFSS